MRRKYTNYVVSVCIFFSRIEGTRGDKNQIFCTLATNPCGQLLPTPNLTSIFDYISCCCLHIDPKFYVANTSEDDQVLSVDGDDIILEVKEENKDIQLWIQGTVYMFGQ